MSDAMPTARATTARTLTQAAFGCLLIGMVVGSPAGGMFLFVLGALFALPAALLARDRARIVACVALLAALGLAFYIYPEFSAEMAAYRQHAKPG